jgi:hypothetical protein
LQSQFGDKITKIIAKSLEIITFGIRPQYTAFIVCCFLEKLTAGGAFSLLTIFCRAAAAH